MSNAETADDVARLRAEVEQLRADLRMTERECAILQSLQHVRGREELTRFQIGSRERMQMLEHTVETLEDFAREQSQWDCYDYCSEDAPCTPCRARQVLADVRAWRYGGSMKEPSRRFVGALHYRTSNGWNPREAKIHAAWTKHMETWGSDRTLGNVLTDRSPGQPDGIRDWPSARDWYVATSVVQWLATNVGLSILEAAGWSYTQWEEDSAQIRQREQQEQERTVQQP